MSLISQFIGSGNKVKSFQTGYTAYTDTGTLDVTVSSVNPDLCIVSPTFYVEGASSNINIRLINNTTLRFTGNTGVVLTIRWQIIEFF